MLKRYKVYGVAEKQYSIKVGNKPFDLYFEGGRSHSDHVDPVPATFMTSDPITQIVIENSIYYKNGEILPDTTFNEAANVEDKSVDDITKYLDVKTWNAARTILIKQYGESISTIMSKDDVLRLADVHHISFPNMK